MDVVKATICVQSNTCLRSSKILQHKLSDTNENIQNTLEPHLGLVWEARSTLGSQPFPRLESPLGNLPRARKSRHLGSPSDRVSRPDPHPFRGGPSHASTDRESFLVSTSLAHERPPPPAASVSASTSAQPSSPPPSPPPTPQRCLWLLGSPSPSALMNQR